jgi:hypothetical protein
VDGARARGLWRALLRFVIPGLTQLGATMGGHLAALPPPMTDHENNDTTWRYRPAVPLSSDEGARWTDLVRQLSA